MLWIPIVTTIIFGIASLLVFLYLFDVADNVKETRICVLFEMINTWVIASTWVLYYH